MIMSLIQAVYGGRISGRKEKGLKVNPIYHDSFHSHQPPGQDRRDHNGNMNGIYLEMYETFPPRRDKNASRAIPKEIATVPSDKTMPALNGTINDIEQKVTVIEHTSAKTMHPTLLGPGDNLVPNISQENAIQNGIDNQDSTNKILQTNCNIQNGNQTDEILADLKSKKFPNDNYALLGYNNEGYIKDKDEVTSEASFLGVPGTDPQESVPVCHSIDSSPSKSSISSSGSPKKIGKFVTQVSVHVIEYSDDPAKSVKLESFDKETNRDSELTDLKSAAVNDEPYDEILIVTQEETNFEPKVKIVNETEQTKGPRTLNDTVIEDTKDKHDEKDPKDVIIQFEEEKNAQSVEGSEIQSHKGYNSNSESKSTKYTKSSALTSNKLKKENKKTDSHDSSDGETSQNTLKSILTNASPDERTNVPDHSHNRTNSDTEIHEAKSVKFSKDTVFNENKPKKYKNERIDRFNLRNIYHGRISSDSAIAKLNPLFSNDIEDYDQDSLTDDEKVAYRLSLRKMMESNGKVNTIRHEKLPVLSGFRPGITRTCLLSYRS